MEKGLPQVNKYPPMPEVKPVNSNSNDIFADYPNIANIPKQEARDVWLKAWTSAVRCDGLTKCSSVEEWADACLIAFAERFYNKK